MLKNSVTVLTISDIPIKLHVTFLLILPFFAVVIANNIGDIAAMAGVDAGQLTLSPYWLGLILALLLFASVAMHELAHSFAARGMGIEIESITLMLLGGVAQMEDIRGEEKDEVWMAFSGPLFSLVFGISLLFFRRYISGAVVPEVPLVVYYLGYMNVFLAIFNLLPAFPSDGGRILRSLLARRLPYLQATRIASAVGKASAFFFAVIGLLAGHIFLILIAFFIYIGATQEYEFNVLKDVFSDFIVADLMTREVSTVHRDMTVEQLIKKMMEERHSGYPVMDDQEQLVGCVTMEDIESASSEAAQRRKISDIMTAEIISVTPQTDLHEAFRQLSEADIGRLMVVDEGDELVGILTRSDIMKAYRLKTLHEKKSEVPNSVDV